MPISFTDTLFIRAFSFAKIPLLFWASPRVISLNGETCVISLPFTRRNKNHLGSMYFGALCIGADASGGMIAARLLSQLKGAKGSLIFKDFSAKFLKRPEGETYFTCKDGLKISDAVNKALETGERVDLPVEVIATVPSLSGDEPVANFVLTLSLKVKKNG